MDLYESYLHDFEKNSENSKILSQYLMHYDILKRILDTNSFDFNERIPLWQFPIKNYSN